MSIRRFWRGAPCKRLFIAMCAALAFGLLARPAAAGTITVAWDLMEDLTVTGYRVYVGTAPGNYTETFDVSPDRSSFTFRSAFMGVRYFFAVAAQFNDSTFGARSSEVTGVGIRTVAGDLPGGARVGDPQTASDCASDCYVVTELARNRGAISSLAASSAGAIFAVEGGRRVLMLQGASVVTALEAEPGTTLGEIALDPHFDTTGRVFVSVLRQRDASAADLELLRLRYLAGRLAEPLAIATGVSVPLGASVPFSIDRAGLLYLAVPATAGRGPYSGAVLAFDQDGRVPSGQRPFTPVVARGFDQPEDLTWDDQAGVLWLAGQNEGAGSQLLAISRSGTTPGAPNVLGDSDDVRAIGVARGAARRLLVGAGADLIETTLDGTNVQRIPLDRYGDVVAVEALPGGASVVAVRRADAPSGPTYSILKVAAGLAVFTR